MTYRLPALALIIAAITVPLASAQTAQIESKSPMASSSTARFDANVAAALLAMQTRAGELKVTGVAVLAYFDGDKPQSWDSRMLVVGRMKDDAKGTDKGSNLLGIAYAKASEMADTLKDSGSQVRPPMTGEFGWQGGVIVPCGSGYLIAAFSGGKSEDDVLVSRAGVEALAPRMK
jgi:hypothetical protein